MQGTTEVGKAKIKNSLNEISSKFELRTMETGDTTPQSYFLFVVLQIAKQKNHAKPIVLVQHI